LIGFGIAGVIIFSVKELVALRFFLACAPLFLMYLFVLNQTVRVDAPCCGLPFQDNQKVLPFLEVFPGKRILQHLVSNSLHFSLSTVVFFYFSCGNDSDILAWISASIIFVLGIFYCIMHCFCGSKEEKEEEEEKDKSSKGNDTVRAIKDQMM
jgi:hypothetical protein